MEATKLALLLMSEKGLAALQGALTCVDPGFVSMVVGCRDASVRNDYYEEIRKTCDGAGIRFYDRSSAPPITADYALAISWRWMIHGVSKLIVLHDSLLPRYRGFAPLPNALINGEPEIGVTALYASEEYDRGDILFQRRLPVSYPIKIQQAIQHVLPLYIAIVKDLCSALTTGAELPRHRQDESQASYSLWRDDHDYEIDWSGEASRIRRFIDALGFPYLGARSWLNQELVTILGAEVEPDVVVENRTAGKVIFLRDGHPVVVCGSGLLRITEMTAADGRPLLPLKKFRSRFETPRPPGYLLDKRHLLDK